MSVISIYLTMTTKDKKTVDAEPEVLEEDIEEQEDMHNNHIEENVAEEMADIFDDLEVESIIPSMRVADVVPDEKPCIVKDEEILGLYDEIINNCRQDREQADNLLLQFLDMVMNDGESSSASKEAIVNLMKNKTDINDKMAKIADLMTRIKLKERDTFPRYLAAQQNNKVVIEDKRDFLKSIEKIANKRKNK